MIPANASVAVRAASANRDEREFEDPGRFDVTRHTKGHLGFGQDIHFCLGASVARLEALVAFEALLPEFPGSGQFAPHSELIVTLRLIGRAENAGCSTYAQMDRSAAVEGDVRL